MGPPTRRRALRSAAALLAGLAGCAGSTGRVRIDRSPPDRHRFEPPTLLVRNPARERFVHVPPPGGGDPDEPLRPRDGILSERTPVEELAFTADVDGAADARRFVRRTDFERESVFVTHEGVGACFQLEPCWVAWSSTEVVVRFRERYRDADVACEADRQHVAAAFVRIPDTLEDAVVRERETRSGDRCVTPDAWSEQTTRLPPGGPGETGGRG